MFALFYEIDCVPCIVCFQNSISSITQRVACKRAYEGSSSTTSTVGNSVFRRDNSDIALAHCARSKRLIERAQHGAGLHSLRLMTVDLPHISVFQPYFDSPDRRILYQIALRSSEGLVVVGAPKCVARINAAILSENLVPILLHSVSQLVVVHTENVRLGCFVFQCPS